MPYSELRQEFWREVVRSGAPAGGLGPKLERWLEEFYKVPAARGRRLNRFSMEVSVLLPAYDLNSTKKPLYSCNTGAAIGYNPVTGDMNLQSCRSRSVADLVASLAVPMAFLQHCRLALFYQPDFTVVTSTTTFINQTCASATRQFTALEMLALKLHAAKILPPQERLVLAGHKTKYGYYITAPKTYWWSPGAMFLVLTLVKLVAARPELMLDMRDYPPQQGLKNLLAWFKSLDDDAAISLRMLEKFGWPLFTAAGAPGKWPVPSGDPPNGFVPRNFHPAEPAKLVRWLEGIKNSHWDFSWPQLKTPKHPLVTKYLGFNATWSKSLHGVMMDPNKWGHVNSASTLSSTVCMSSSTPVPKIEGLSQFPDAPAGYIYFNLKHPDKVRQILLQLPGFGKVGKELNPWPAEHPAKAHRTTTRSKILHHAKEEQ